MNELKKSELKKLLNEMTLEEKIGQMTQLAGYLLEQDKSDLTGPLGDMDVPLYLDSTYGSVVGSYGAATIKEIQEKYLERSRLKIPLLFMADIIHGYKTIFPIPLATGSSWNLELAEKSTEVAAKESSVSGLHLTFSPMVDLVRDPRWGRVLETTGEDPYLNSEFARAFIKGYQGDDLSNDHSRIAACVKHFIGYGATQGGREYNTVDISRKELFESYLPSFEAAIDAGVQMVMTAFNPIDGIPVTGNSDMANDLLRKKLGFEGVTISDWNSLGELITNGVASNETEAAEKGLNATIDIEMMTFCYAKRINELLDAKKIDMSVIDESVMRVLNLKNTLGLFENPYRGLNVDQEESIVFSDSNRKVAREVAEESIILLKNDGVLPLKSNQKIALIGPFSQESNVLGVWSWRGEISEASQLRPAMEEKVSEGNLKVALGCNLTEESDDLLSQAVRIAKDSDVVILAIGEEARMSGEASSRSDIRVPAAQRKLVCELRKVSKKIVTVLFNGRPLDLEDISDNSDAILETWFLGSETGKAIANVLFGDVNPSGKTTMSFPENVGQIPVHYNHYTTGRPYKAGSEDKWVSRYLDVPNEPAIPFGFGLSYTSFDYGEINVSSNTFSKNSSLNVSMSVTNSGDMAGKEVVQFYVQDLVGEVIRPVKELKGFKKIYLEPGETQTITFELTEEMVRYTHSDLDKRSDLGDFKVYIGSSSVRTKEKTVELI